MENFYKSIGAMCGSSCDGIDFSLIMTNGTDNVKTVSYTHLTLPTKA